MFSLRGALWGGGVAAVLTWLFASPLIVLSLLVFLLGQCTYVIGDAIIDGPTMGDAWIPEMIEVLGVVEGPHMSAKMRQGAVITMKVHNKSRWQHTPYEEVGGGPPLYMGCRLSGDLYSNGRLLGHTKGRGLAFAITWDASPAGEVTYPVLRPGQTMNLEFSTKVDGDFRPIEPDEIVEQCVIGGNMEQALLAVGISISDSNRGAIEHYPMASVTDEGRRAGYVPE